MNTKTQCERCDKKSYQQLEDAAKEANKFFTNALAYGIFNEADARKAIAVSKKLEEAIYYT